MDLLAEVTEVDGIGKQIADHLRKFGIYTVRDLFYFLPRDYENFQSHLNQHQYYQNAMPDARFL